MRKIAAVTVGRSDFGIYLPVLRAIDADPDLDLHLVVSGAHLSPTFGSTIDEIHASGIRVCDRVDMLVASDAPEAIAKSIGLGIIGFAQVYQSLDADILLTLGDRFEMLAAVQAAVPFKLPIAHIHGGEVTTGAIDDAFRHSITKCSHLHFASTHEHRRRIVQLGEAPWRVVVSGAPALDHLTAFEPDTRESLERRIGISLQGSPLLVTYHPVTLQYEQTKSQMVEFLAGLNSVERPIVITMPNADTSSQQIVQMLRDFAAGRKDVALVDNLGTQAYFSMMTHAAAMVGNSSSGIIEAASFALPVVNVGIRQDGRPRSGNVIDVGHGREEIQRAIEHACTQSFRASLSGLANVYGQGNAAERIKQHLKSVSLDESLLVKQFFDVDLSLPEGGIAA